MAETREFIIPYPAQYESDVVLRDGSTLRFRPIRPDDAEALLALHDRLSRQSQKFRFFGLAASYAGEVSRLLQADHDNEFVLVAEAGKRLIGAATYVRDPARVERAEVSFAIADAVQGRGVGTRMLEMLASIARDHHIQTFEAYVLSDNDRMMRVFLDSGFEVQRRLEGGIFHVVLSLVPTARYENTAAARSHAAATASMKTFFEPRTVAVIGANRARGKIGSEILHNLVVGGFSGQLFVVHPTASSVEGVPAFPTVTAVPSDVDLAIICVPCASVSATVNECIAKGVKALVVISAGFAETGASGRALEAAILDNVRAAGIRMIGPNCMGIINTDPAIRLNATFSPMTPPDGRVAFLTQSGALGLAILEQVQELDLGLSTFVSVGNKADVSGNDLLQYWADDPRTDVILLYLESFGNPRRFAQIARRVADRKPVVAVKSGRSRSGARAAASHTGALATNDVVVDALFHQAGVIRTGTVEELFDVATLLAHQPIPAGPRVAVLSNAGGPAILAADACEGHGLQLAALSDATVRRLRLLLPAAASVSNPVDMLASATPEHYRCATRLLLADEQVDSLLVIFIPPLVTQATEVATAISSGSVLTTKPVIATFMGSQDVRDDLGRIPSYRFPESAVMALARTTAYGAWRRRPRGSFKQFADIRPEIIRRVVDDALARGQTWLTPAEAKTLAEGTGLSIAPTLVATTAGEVVVAAQQIGYPVALKAIGPEIVHKTEVGGVMLDIPDERSLCDAFAALKTRLGDTMTGAVVQQMVPGGVELLVGAVVDPVFGPLVACGSGGVLVDLLGDTTFRLHPVTDVEAADMIGALKSSALLRGYRGQAPCDEAAAIDAVLRVSMLLELCPEIQELELNPLKVLTQGARAVDIRVRVGHAPLRAGSRRISY